MLYLLSKQTCLASCKSTFAQTGRGRRGVRFKMKRQRPNPTVTVSSFISERPHTQTHSLSVRRESRQLELAASSRVLGRDRLGEPSTISQHHPSPTHASRHTHKHRQVHSLRKPLRFPWELASESETPAVAPEGTAHGDAVSLASGWINSLRDGSELVHLETRPHKQVHREAPEN